MRRKILIATAAFFPENSPRSFRATELAKEFARQGHEVCVLTLPRGMEANEFCQQHGIELKCVSPRRLCQIPIFGSGFRVLLGRIANRVLLQLFEYPDIELMFKYRKALKEENFYDLMISVAVPYPVHWGVAWARQLNHRIATHWIADCGDPYMGNQSDSFSRFFYFAIIEKWMFRKADSIAIPIESARQAYFPEFHSKIAIIPQGVNFADLRSFCKIYRPHSIRTFAYAGTFIQGKRDPRNFLDHLIRLESDFRFIIYTQAQTWLLEYMQRSGGRIVVQSPIPRLELIASLSQVDFLVNIENSTMTQAPSKLIDYHVTGRPVISIHSTQVDFPVLREFMAGDFKSSMDLGGMENYRIETVVKSFLSTAKLEYA